MDVFLRFQLVEPFYIQHAFCLRTLSYWFENTGSVNGQAIRGNICRLLLKEVRLTDKHLKVALVFGQTPYDILLRLLSE